MTTYINLKAVVFTEAQILAVAKKRYRDVFHGDDVKNALTDAIVNGQTLEQAARALVTLYVQTDGHEKNLILTPEELVERKHKTDCIGIVKAIISAMRAGNGANENQLKTVVRYQINLRKLNVDPLFVGSTIVSRLIEQNLSLFVWENNVRVWRLVHKPRSRQNIFLVDQLTDDELMTYCPELLTVQREFIQRPAPRLEPLEEF